MALLFFIQLKLMIGNMDAVYKLYLSSETSADKHAIAVILYIHYNNKRALYDDIFTKVILLNRQLLAHLLLTLAQLISGIRKLMLYSIC